MVKLKDIAEHLHVSVSTISRVVNNKDRVDPETRKRILETLRKFNYQPNENARRLKTNTSNVFGVIVPDISNPFYASVLKGIERISSQNGYSVMLCNTDEIKAREKSAIHLLLRQNVAGFMVATVLDDASVLKYYSQLECPAVFFDNVPSVDVHINCVTIDNIRAAREMVGYMINQGHRKIFMISGPAGESSADERLAGWKMALKDVGVEPGNDWIQHGDFREETGRLIMKDFLQRSDRPTAVCVANNFMAYGAVKSIFEAGLSIPDDISIGAFDVVDTTGLIKLQMTSIVQPAEDIGVVAADMCVQASGQKKIKMSRKIVLEHQLLKNNTVKPLLDK